MKIESRITPQRFYSLDVLRGLASLSVVLWHWQHFFYQGTKSTLFDVSKQPFYSVFYLFYHKGALAVDLFFALSGFVFFWLYASNIFLKQVNAFRFFVYRFSRLYPLHFITLILVLIGQVVAMKIIGNFIVYPNNDLYNFILNIFFISNWGFETDFSFNGPIWSVSVEVMLYIVFFIFSYLGFTRKFWFCILVIFGCTYIPNMPDMLVRGFFSFFVGGLVYLFYKKTGQNIKLPFIYFICIITTLLWVFTFYSISSNYQITISSEIQWIDYIVQVILKYFATAVLFPLTIFSLVIAETYKGSLGKRISIIGDLTYSMYLLHFPLQMIFIFIFYAFSLPKDYFFNEWLLVLFIIILFLASYFSFVKVEKPLQKFLRIKILKNKV
ncbi:MAG: acyltransferase [Bacteroidales bacterium]|nr:acyltransferase [Bacteroidales bacterium]